ncbi:hypothetical protein BDM02DRAFT_3117413 [Thelephora ganbajun]|uniref:Uncharacterized protein n=1 Tax=Thelephora ganbajun TaxID=370292 RepID=A0ACB6ZCB8_THEGA|nr:hypothetical protein BDM02DRAFT_3117413 [Thelephora ganbajun]
MTGVLRNQVGASRSQITLRSAEDASRWLGILSENPEGPGIVHGLHVSGVESFPSLLTWPKLESLHHLGLRGIDFRDPHEPLTPFLNAYSSSVDELVLEGLRFREAEELFALIIPFKNLNSLVIHDVEWGNGELLDDDEAGSGSESESEDETHKHTMQPGDCCSIAIAGLHLVDDVGVDLPTLKHLSLRGCSSTITRCFARMPSKLCLSRLEISWEDEHLLPLGEMIEACAPSLSELSISGVSHTECDYPLSLSSCTQLSSLYLNGVHLFLDEPLGPALHHLASTLPTPEASKHPRFINVCFTLDMGPAWASRIDNVDWDAVAVSLASLESRLDNNKDNWVVAMKVDSSYLPISGEEERQILDVAGQKLERFSAVLRLDIH